MLRRPFFAAVPLFALLLTAGIAHGQGLFRGGSFGLGFFPPSHYGYNLDDPSTGYYGGGRYREYYSYGRGYGLANYPGPVPGPMYYADPYSITPPKRLPPLYAPPAPPDHPVSLTTSSRSIAYLVVQTPPDAEVWLEDVPSNRPGTMRLFVSPPLTPGAKYAYAVRARWSENGQPTEQTQEIIVQAGDRVTVRFPTGPDLELLPAPKSVKE